MLYSRFLKNSQKNDRTLNNAQINIPRLSCPNAEVIFRKVTPSESVANIRLTFREENHLEMRNSNEVGGVFFGYFLAQARK